MNIAMTGHTRGIGRALVEILQQRGHTVLCFSRANGYDISNDESRGRICHESQHCDCFVNNAYSPTAQTQMLQDMIHHWRGQPRRIVNIGSIAAFIAQHPQLDHAYLQDKLHQMEICNQNLFNNFPCVINVMPGLVDTDFVSGFSDPKMSTITVARIIADVMGSTEVITRQIVFSIQ